MKSNEAIKQVLKEARITQERMGELLGISQGNVARRLTSDNMTANQMVKFLDAAGYELVVQPKQSWHRPKYQIVIDQLNKEDKSDI